MADHPSKTRWEADNVIKLTVKINRNQDPELFRVFATAEGSRSALAKDLIRKGITADDVIIRLLHEETQRRLAEEE